jgi:hypothetical protein
LDAAVIAADESLQSSSIRIIISIIINTPYGGKKLTS